MAWLKTAKLTRFELYDTRTDLAREHDLSERESTRFKSMKSYMLELHRSFIEEGPTWAFDQL